MPSPDTHGHGPPGCIAGAKLTEGDLITFCSQNVVNTNGEDLQAGQLSNSPGMYDNW